MRPVVSSILALALALVPCVAMATPEKSGHKPVAAKVMKHQQHSKKDKVDKIDKVDKVAKVDKEKAQKPEKGDKAPIVHIKHAKKDGKPILHHAHGVDVGGAGHKEPKMVVPVSLSTVVTSPVAGSSRCRVSVRRSRGRAR